MPNGYDNNIFSSKRFMCSNLGFFSRQILRLDGIVYQRSSALTQCAKKGISKNGFFPTTLRTGMIVPHTFIDSYTFSQPYAPYSRPYVYSIWVQRLNMLILDEEKALLYGSKIDFNPNII